MRNPFFPTEWAGQCWQPDAPPYIPGGGFFGELFAGINNNRGNENLTLQEIAAFQLFFPGQDIRARGYTAEQVRQSILSSMEDEFGDAGVQRLSDRALASENIQEDIGCQVRSEPLTQSTSAELHAQTYVPIKFRMRHARACAGRHLAMVGTKIVMTFVNKRSCNAYCRAWNSLFAHTGCADEFIPQDVVQVFSDVLVGGSGEFGKANEFTPPFRGRV